MLSNSTTLRLTVQVLLASAAGAAVAAPAPDSARPAASPTIATKQVAAPIPTVTPTAKNVLPAESESTITASIAFDESTLVPVPESPSSYGAELRRQAEWRQSFRDKLGWANLDEGTKKALAGIAVGSDQLDSSGRAIVTRAWAYTPTASAGEDRRVNDMFLNVEGDLVLAGYREAPSNSFLLTEVKGAASGADFTQNWYRVFGLAGGATCRTYGTTCDLNGNAFAVGEYPSNGRYFAWQFEGDTGATIGSLLTFTAGGQARATSVAVDPIEGLIYVVGTGDGYPGGFLAQHKPGSSLTRSWIVPMPWAGGSPAAFDSIRINRFGEIFVVGSDLTHHMTIAKLSPMDGAAEWVWTDTATSYGNAIDVDFDGNPYITGNDGDFAGWKTAKFDRLTGVKLWSVLTTSGNPTDIAVDMQGNAFVCGRPGNASSFSLRKYNKNGVQQWNTQWGTTGSDRMQVALDRLGNPYVTGEYGSTTESIDTRKFDPATGTEQWQIQDSPVASSETNEVMRVTGIRVDATGSVYVGGYRVANLSGGAQGNEYFAVKYTQPYEYIPQVTTYNPDIRAEKRSLWNPASQDDGNIVSPASGDLLNATFSLFSLPLNPVETILDPVCQGSVSYGLQGNGLAQGGLDFGFTTSTTKLGVNCVTDIDGGTFDVSTGGTLDVETPPDGGSGGLSAGDPIPMSITYTPDPKKLELIANNAVSFKMKLQSVATGDMTVRAYATDTTVGTILNEYILSAPNLSRLNGYDLIAFDTTQYPIPANDWYDIRAGSYPQSTFADAQVRLPKLSPEARYDASIAKLTSSVSETFVKGQVNITNIASYFATIEFGGYVPSFSYESSSAFHDFSVYAAILQAYLRGDIAIEQDLTLELKPYVTLAFDSGAPAQTIDLVKTGTAGNYYYQATYTYPNQNNASAFDGLPTDGNIEVTPTFGMKAVFTNRTGLHFGAYAGFKPVDVSLSVSVVGIDVVDENACLGCLEQDLIALASNNARVKSALNGGDLNLLNKTYPTFTFPEEQAQAPIQIVGDINNNPKLAGSSRAFAPMVIYDQRNPPTQSEFNTDINASEPMVLYGERFKDPAITPNLLVKMKHHGRTENLTYTRINDNALLVQVPRRFRLLPGIAKIWVQNNNGRSKSIDFPITYPTPNFTGLSDQVWAGDQRWSGDSEVAGMGLIALDGGSPGGHDTWIARRDYYTYLRTTLWNGGFLPAGNTNTTAQTWYPSFKGWETGANLVPPGFPTLVAITASGEVPLARYRQLAPLPEDNNDGYFRSKLQERVIRSPGFVDFEIVNPGPGGGESRIRTVEIPAPRPVLSELYPAVVNPGSVAPGEFLRLDVRGPESVPFFAGYESKKYGNFTPESVVKIDGVAVTTQYINPGKLVGLIPAAALGTFANRIITVTTPSNGTQFTEQLKNGSGTITFSGPIDSGGTSDPLVLQVFWPEPSIASASHSTLTVNAPPPFPTAINGQQPDGYNFSVVGRNFAPGCVVTWNGNPMQFSRIDEGHLRLLVTAANVAQVGTSRVQVVNPVPNARASNVLAVQITP